MKPYIHAKSSAAKYGGTPEEYLFIHDWMDNTKAACADVRHRAVFHSAFGCFIAEQVFGHNYTNSLGKNVSIRDLAEQHIQEDLGFIPSLEQWVKNMPIEDWMMGRNKGVKSTTSFIPMEETVDIHEEDAIVDALVVNTEAVNDIYIDGNAHRFFKGERSKYYD